MHFNVEPGVIVSTLYDTEICSIQNNETCNFFYIIMLTSKILFTV